MKSLLDEMVDGREYNSIVDAVPAQAAVLMDDTRRAIAELEAARGRPCLCYVANPIKSSSDTGIAEADFLPFVEMLRTVPSDQKEVDLFIATPGGNAQTVLKMVEAVRRRFDHIEFVIPADAMSAGTLFALAGDEIWMTETAYLGPIDPQTPGRGGQFVPMQALLTLLAKIQSDGAKRLSSGQQPDWSQVVLLKNLDPKEIGHAMSLSEYSTNMAAQFLAQYKFRTWDRTESGKVVDEAYRDKRAREVAEDLCSHEKWRAHGHRINRDVLWNEIQLKISHPESISGLDRLIRRLWAMWYYTFDKSNITKVMMGTNYTFVRFSQER